MSQRTVLVTGAAGFIASHITRALVSRGDRVRALDFVPQGPQWSRLSDLDDRIERITGSILDSTALAAAVKDVDVIIHHAALVSVPESVERPMDYHATDATGTLNLLEAARQHGHAKVIYASTSAAYGDDPEQPKRETMLPSPMSPYAVAKYTGECYVSAYAALHGMKTISLRYFNVFGPGQNPKSQYGAAVPSIVTKMLRGERPIIYGDGEQTRDFCHVDNVVHSNLLAAESETLAGQVVNIGCGVAISVNQIVTTVNDVTGLRVQADYAAPRAGEVRHSLADISAARRVLGYEPKVMFEQGLRQAIDWYRTIA